MVSCQFICFFTNAPLGNDKKSTDTQKSDINVSIESIEFRSYHITRKSQKKCRDLSSLPVLMVCVVLCVAVQEHSMSQPLQEFTRTSSRYGMLQYRDPNLIIRFKKNRIIILRMYLYFS